MTAIEWADLWQRAHGELATKCVFWMRTGDLRMSLYYCDLAHAAYLRSKEAFSRHLAEKAERVAN